MWEPHQPNTPQKYHPPLDYVVNVIGFAILAKNFICRFKYARAIVLLTTKYFVISISDKT